MIKVSFTANLARHISVDAVDLEDGTLFDVLTQLFSVYPSLQPYILDEQEQLRQHIMLALDKQLVQGDLGSVGQQSGFSRLHIMQALSGG